MVSMFCRQCSAEFKVTAYRAKTAIYCSPSCCYKRMAGNRFAAGHKPTNAFPPGHRPWNLGVSVRMSPATEFKPGQRPSNHEPIGTVKIRHRNRGAGSDRAWVKVAEPNHWKPRAVIVWEQYHGRPLPEEMVVHHHDRNPLNDDPANLLALTKAEHALEHKKDLLEAQRKRRSHRRASRLAGAVAAQSNQQGFAPERIAT
jgi:hypothetical protein